ncbi:hypothetical protein NFJ02_37g92830 [Pycnococcus provasolii]
MWKSTYKNKPRQRIWPAWTGFPKPHLARQGGVVQALGLPQYVTKAANAAHKLKRASPLAKVALFTDIDTLATWQRRARASLLELVRRPAHKSCRSTSKTSAGASLSPTCDAPAPEAAVDLFGVFSPFDYVVLYDGAGAITIPELPKAAEASRWQKSGMLWMRKIATYQHTPFENTLFTDSDACTCPPARGRDSALRNMAALIGSSDFVSVMDDKGHGGTPPPAYDPKNPVPMEFDERNGGFNLYRRTSAVEALFRAWMEVFVWHSSEGDNLPKVTHDQPALREAIYVATRHYRLRELLLPNRGRGGICRGFDKEQKMRCEGMTWSQFFRRQGELQMCGKPPQCDTRDNIVKAKAYATRAARRVLTREKKTLKEIDVVVDEIESARRSLSNERMSSMRRITKQGYSMGPGCEDGCMAVHEKCECWKRRGEDVRMEKLRDPMLRILTKAARIALGSVPRGTNVSDSGFPWNAINEQCERLARAHGMSSSLVSNKKRFAYYDGGRYVLRKRPPSL